MPGQNAPQPLPKKKPPILVRHAVSLGIAFVLALPASYYAGLWINQQVQLGKLMSPDDERFNQGIAYVVEYAWQKQSVEGRAIQAVNDAETEWAGNILVALAASFGQNEQPIPGSIYDAIPSLVERMTYAQAIGLYDGLSQTVGIDLTRVREAVLDQIVVKDGELLDAVNLLEQRLLWSKQLAPRPMWIAWAARLAQSEAELTQYKAAQLLGELPDDLDNERVTTSLQHLTFSKYDRVRDQALAACAGYAAIADNPTPFEQVIFKLGSDTNQTIARRAWLIVGHLDPLSGFAVDWKQAAPAVAKAMLWSTAKTNPDRPDPVWQAYDNEQTRPISLIALSELGDEESRRRFAAAITQPEPEEVEIDIDRLIAYVSAGNDLPDAAFDLACIQSIQDDELALDRANRLVRSNATPLRLLGVLIAALSNTRPTLVYGITPEFLRQNPDIDATKLPDMTDDELTRLGLRRVDALAALLEAAESSPPSANRRAEADMLRLAMWVRGDLGDDFTPRAESMLFDTALPKPTVLMCLLHKRRPVALRYLLGDLVTPRPDLYELFVQQRWWHVFSQTVDAEDLPLWLWAKSDDQGFQLEAMRQWYAVNRWRIERGVWPGGEGG